jgi:hypothetical protein
LVSADIINLIEALEEGDAKDPEDVFGDAYP